MRVRHLVLGLVVLSVVGAWFFTPHYATWLGVEEAGAWGDQFGSTNALFSGLALCGLIYTLVLQSHELSLQRKELSATRATLESQRQELADTRSVQQELVAEQARQHFTELFSTTMLVWRDAKAAVICEGNSGSHAINLAASEFQRRISRAVPNTSEPTTATDEWRAHRKLLVGQAYEEYVRTDAPDLLHVFRLLYQLLRLIEEAPPGVDRQKHSRLVRAQMSLGEQLLLIYNATSRWGEHKLFPLVEKYDLLQHLDDTLIGHDSYWDARAFSSYSDRPSSFTR